MLKPHTDYPFVINEKLLIESEDGSFEYFQLTYEQDVCAWILIPYVDKYFSDTKKDENGDTIGEFVYAYGIETLQRLSDYEIEDLP